MVDSCNVNRVKNVYEQKENPDKHSVYPGFVLVWCGQEELIIDNMEISLVV